MERARLTTVQDQKYFLPLCVGEPAGNLFVIAVVSIRTEQIGGAKHVEPM